MQKVVVIGSGGSGKSAFSRRLGEVTGLPVVHLDQLFWRPNWTRTPDAEWKDIVRDQLDRDAWIMDGNFGGTRAMRIEACDTVILLDLPRWRCIYRVLKRTVLYHGKTRPDMADGCKERFDAEFMLWIWNYPNSGRRRVLDELKCREDRRIVRLTSPAEIERFLRNLD